MNRSEYSRAHRKTFLYFGFDKAVEFFSCLSIVLAFYVIASWIFDGSSDQSTLAYLWQLEDRFESFKKFLSRYLIFKPWVSAILIAILIGIDLLYSYSVGFDPPSTAGEEGKPKSLVSRYLSFQKLSKRAYILLALLCSFTFFGNAVAGEKIARVQVRIERIRTGYEEVREETEGVLTALVQQDLLQQIDDDTGVGLRATYGSNYYHDIVYSSDSKVESLQKTYSKARSTPNIVIDRALEARVNKTTSKRPPAYNGPRTVHYSDNPSADTSVKTATRYTSKSRPPALSELTLEKIEEVKSSFKKAGGVQRSISAIKLADGTEVLVQLPKSFTNIIKSAAFNDLVVRFPILEPLFNWLVSTFDKTMEEKIKSRAGPHLDRILDKWFPRRTLTRADFENEAKEIVKSSKTNPTNEVIKNTRAAAGEYVAVISESDRLIKQLEGQIEIATPATRPSIDVDTLPPSVDLDTLPEATCAQTARENYETRIRNAKTLQDRLKATSKYLSDLERLERGSYEFPRRGSFGFPGLGSYEFPRRDSYEFPRRDSYRLPRLKPG